MAIITFDEAHKVPEEMTIITNTGKEYHGFFSDIRLDRSTLPAGWSAYDIREDDENGEMGTLEYGYVFVNHFGTFYMNGSIEELNKDNTWVNLGSEDKSCWDYTF